MVLAEAFSFGVVLIDEMPQFQGALLRQSRWLTSEIFNSFEVVEKKVRPQGKQVMLIPSLKALFPFEGNKSEYERLLENCAKQLPSVGIWSWERFPNCPRVLVRWDGRFFPGFDMQSFMKFINANFILTDSEGSQWDLIAIQVAARIWGKAREILPLALYQLQTEMRGVKP